MDALELTGPAHIVRWHVDGRRVLWAKDGRVAPAAVIESAPPDHRYVSWLSFNAQVEDDIALWVRADATERSKR
jgi:hypothetical protein